MARLSKVFYAFLAADALLLGTAVLLAIVSFMWMQEMDKKPTLVTVARWALISKDTLKGGLGNAILIVLTVAVSLPALAMRTSTVWLRIHGGMVLMCAIYTLILGLAIWMQTLSTTKRLGAAWSKQSVNTQSLLQTRFGCCGYFNSTSPPFQVDATCPDDFAAASRPGCSGAFVNFANAYLGLIFTGAFGIVVVDVIVFLCAAMLVRTRKEEIRYRYLDRKQGGF